MKRLALLSILIVSAYLTAFSQQAANATLNGTVTDPNGAVVAGAKITATQTATTVTRNTVTSDDGLYVLSNMSPGTYELKFELKGFATKILKDVSLNVGQTATFNVSLEVGTVSVTLDDEFGMQPLVDTSDSLVNGIIRT